MSDQEEKKETLEQNAPVPEEKQVGGKTDASVAERFFTQEELNKIIGERTEREKAKWEKRLAEEIAKREEELQTKLSEYEKQLIEKEIEATALKLTLAKQKALLEAGLPINLANRVFGETEEEIKKDVEELKQMWGSLEKSRIGEPTNPVSGQLGAKTFTREEIGHMTPEELEQNWEYIAEALRKGLIK